MGDTKERMKKACPTLRELADRLDATITLINELHDDHNSNIAAVTQKLNTVIARTEDLATKYSAHLTATHPDTTHTLAGSVVTDISATDNIVASPKVEAL